MKKKKIFITGMSGYLGTCLCRELERVEWCTRVYGLDIKKPLYKYRKAEFRQMDITDPALVQWVSEIKPDILVHLAYVLEQIHDTALMRRVNYDGTLNALRAAREAGVRQVLLASSGTAYGAWPDNPVPLREEHSLRPNPEFYYAVDKARIDRHCQEIMAQDPDLVLAVIRPCVVYGPLVNNYLSDLLLGPLLVGLRGYNPPLQFVHEDDVVATILHLLQRQARGFFNVAPPDTITMREIVELTGKRFLGLPDGLADRVIGLSWRLRLPMARFSPAFLDYIRYPWVIDSGRLLDTGFTFTYSTRETIEILLRAKGVTS